MPRRKIIGGIILGLVLLALLAGVLLAGAVRRGTGVAQGNIGVIRLEGVIGGSDSGLLAGRGVSAEELMDQIRRALEDDSIRAVVLRINSPGGSAPAAQEIAEELDKLRRAGKKVVVSMGDVAASGGYWIAARADRIVANPATLTGSIGVIMETQNLKALYDKIGIVPEVIKSGPHKDMGSTQRPLTPEERDIMQGMVNDIYNQFVDVVAGGRHLDRGRVRKLADGRVYTGRQAKDLGLVDELGDFYDAVRLAGKLAGIKGEPKIYDLAPRGPWQYLTGALDKTISRVISGWSGINGSRSLPRFN